MHPLHHAVTAFGGLIATHELHTIGYGRDRIRMACADGSLERVRQGWYALPGTPAPLLHAARVGGRMDCVSAAAYLGLWDPRPLGPGPLHVAVPENAARLRSPTAYRRRLAPTAGVDVHWWGTGDGVSRLIVPATECIRSVTRCAGSEAGLMVADSALARGVLGTREWEEFLTGLPVSLRDVLSAATPLSESGGETVFTSRMRDLGLPVRQQVRIPGVGRVDALIGDRLICEIDSFAHHRDQLADRRRDAAAAAAGFLVLRFMHHQVMSEWEAVVGAVLAVVARGGHLHPAT